jgi:tetratricopeptide (TPR) repeat protein
LINRPIPSVIAAFLLIAGPVFASEDPSLLQQGEAQLKEGKIPEALETLERAVTEDPQSSLAYTRLGGAQILSQDYAAGIESFKQAISLDAKNAEAFVGMAVAYIHSSRYPLARAALEEAKRIDPTKQKDADELIAWIDKRMTPE